MTAGPRIRDVWTPNLEAEMRNIRALIDRYPYVAMDTEFPGVVARPIGSFKTSSDYHYQTMRCNVDLLKIIQIGITLSSEKGELPEDVTTWQFNFHFSVNEDIYGPDSVDLLQKSGIDFQKHEEFGIPPTYFAELMITSGLVLSDDTTWVSFHSGYDFGYFVKILSGSALPATEDAFFHMLKIWFPRAFDVKSICRAFDSQLKGGLADVAEDLGVTRTGNSYLTGSDSFLTARTFFKARGVYLNDGDVPEVDFNGKLFGLGPVFALPNVSSDAGRSGATMAEREDRSSAMGHAHTLSGHSQGSGMSSLGAVIGLSQTPAMSSAIPTAHAQYPPMGANGAYMRPPGLGAR